MPPTQPFPRPTTQGTVQRGVPCPHCGEMMDFRAHADETSGGKGWGEQALETGAIVECDNERCVDSSGRPRVSKILAIEKVTLVRLKRL